MPRQGTLGVVEFGELLVETGDLDPLYIILYNADMGHDKLCKWLVSYWCFYHAGLSCWIVDQPLYWKAMKAVPVGGTNYPRGSERRHFRGAFAEKAVDKLCAQFGSAKALIEWLGEGDLRAPAIAKKVKSLYGFGEWISGKVPDMVERLGLIDTVFEDRDVDMMFDSPKKGAEEVCHRYCKLPSRDPLMDAHKFLLQRLGHLKAPPRYDRVLNVQETETIFCKWKSHLGGHYPVLKDSQEIMHGLKKYGSCPTAKLLIGELETLHSRQKACQMSL